MASNEIIPKWHCEIAGWEKLPLVRQLILFPHLSLICWSHTLSRRTAAAVYICLRCAGWWQGVKSAVRELSDVPVCAPIKSTWDSPCFSPPLVSMGRRMVKGGELKEPTRRQRPLTDLTSVIRVLQCQHANQIKMNGAYPGHWRLASLGPISSVPVTVHIERLIERLTMPLCEEETQTHTNRFPVNGRGELLQGCETERTGGSRGTPPLWCLIDTAPRWQVHLWDFIVLIVRHLVLKLLSAPPISLSSSRYSYSGCLWGAGRFMSATSGSLPGCIKKHWHIYLWEVHVNVRCWACVYRFKVISVNHAPVYKVYLY